MKYITNPGGESAKQKAERHKEICIKGISPNLCDSIRRNSHGKRCDCLMYQEHIASLPTFPLSASLKQELINKYGEEKVRQGGLEIGAVEGKEFYENKPDRLPLGNTGALDASGGSGYRTVLVPFPGASTKSIYGEPDDRICGVDRRK